MKRKTIFTATITNKKKIDKNKNIIIIYYAYFIYLL